MKKIKIVFDSKTRRAGITALVTIAVLVGLVILNIVASEFSVQADLTPRDLFSLSDQTLELLDGLEKPVEIIGLYEPGIEPESIMDTVRLYEQKSSMVTVRVVSAARNPALIAKYSTDDKKVSEGSFIVTSGDSSRVISGSDFYDISYGQQGQAQFTGQKVEQQITAAIDYVTTGNTPKIYEIIGHGESTLADLGYSAVLEQSNYVLNELNLILSNIPEDAALVTLIGPRSDFSQTEFDKIDAYLNGGGSLLVALDPLLESLKNIDDLLRKWDIVVRNGLVIETRQDRLVSQFGDNPTIFVPDMADHETLNSLKDARLDPIFQTSLGFRPTEARQRRLDYEALLTSSEGSRLRTDLNSPNFNAIDPIDGDEPGPIDLAITVRQKNLDSYKYDGATIVAVGSASTLGGVIFLGQLKANLDMTVNLIRWAVGEQGGVNVPTKNLFRVPLRIGRVTSIIYSIIAILLIPIICILCAWVIHVRRSNR